MGVHSKTFFPSLACPSTLQNRRGIAYCYHRPLHEVTCIKINSSGNTGKLQKTWKTSWSASDLDEAHWETAIRTPSKMSIRRNIPWFPTGELSWQQGTECSADAGGRWWAGPELKLPRWAQTHLGLQPGLPFQALPLSSPQPCFALLAETTQGRGLRMVAWLALGGLGATNTSLWSGQGAQDNQGSPQCPQPPAVCGGKCHQPAPAHRCLC